MINSDKTAIQLLNILFLGFCFSLFLFGCDSFNKSPVWFDEFDYTAPPDSTKWNFDLGNGCPQLCGWGNQELEYYTHDPKNVRVENGVLTIEAHRDSIGGMPYTSARVVSSHKGDWLYGRIEVRAKLPRGRGTWPAIWMLPTDRAYGGWPASGEIDIMEHVGFDPGTIHATVHTEAYNHHKKTQREGIVSIADAQDTFHVYAIDWRKDKIDFFVDDRLYHSVSRTPGDSFREWPFDQRFHLIMNVAVGGFWGGMQGIDDSIWPQRMEVDYVRVYR
jgi:beta-glucanase (GH16 family)